MVAEQRRATAGTYPPSNGGAERRLPPVGQRGLLGAVLPAFVSSVLYSPASRHLPPAAPPPSAKHASVAKPLPLRTNPYEPL